MILYVKPVAHKHNTLLLQLVLIHHNMTVAQMDSHYQSTFLFVDELRDLHKLRLLKQTIIEHGHDALNLNTNKIVFIYMNYVVHVVLPNIFIVPTVLTLIVLTGLYM